MADVQVNNVDFDVSSMTRRGTWGDGITLSAAAALYNRDTRVVTDSGSTFTIESPSAVKESAATLLGYVGSVDALLSE